MKKFSTNEARIKRPVSNMRNILRPRRAVIATVYHAATPSRGLTIPVLIEVRIYPSLGMLRGSRLPQPERMINQVGLLSKSADANKPQNVEEDPTLRTKQHRGDLKPTAHP